MKKLLLAVLLAITSISAQARVGCVHTFKTEDGLITVNLAQINYMHLLDNEIYFSYKVDKAVQTLETNEDAVKLFIDLTRKLSICG